MGISLKEWLKTQPEHIQKAALENPKEFELKIIHELKTREQYYPAKNFVPNIGQQRFNKCLMQPHPTYEGGYPKKMFMFGGNGVGKTSDMAVVLNGIALGPNFVNLEYYNFGYFKFCEEIRRKRPIKIRIVCHKADVEDNGSVVQEIRKWIPTAKFSGKTSGQYYTRLTIPPPDPKQFKTTLIDIKTHDMVRTAHAGPDYDVVIYNEPPPEDIYAENEARTRKGGRSMAFLTPLDMAEYMQKIIDSDYPDGEIFWRRCSIWDNCIEIPGTNGILHRRDIESNIRTWKAINPHEVPAREEGKFMHLSGAVFLSYNDQHHVHDHVDITSDMNIFQGVDHHQAKPDPGVWMGLDPMNIWYVLAEYPTEPWDQITGTVKTIQDFGFDYKLIEDGKHPQFQYFQKLVIPKENRFGDPNAFKWQQPHNRKSIQLEFWETCGLWYNIDEVDNDIALRHDKIKKLLACNFELKIESHNTPHLFVHKSCKNVQRALRNYTAKKKKGALGGIITGQYDDVWKDWIDIIGYIVTTVMCWSIMRTMTQQNTMSEYDAIERGRVGNITQEDMSPLGSFVPHSLESIL